MARRTAVGIDLGTIDIIAANVGRKGVEIVQNSVSERRTPALVSFTDRRRLLGDAALAQVRSNFQNSCRGLKHLIGRSLDAPEVEAERFWSLCPLGQADDGTVGFSVSCHGEKRCISATVCLSMLLTSILATCKAWTNMDVREVVLAIPSYFTETHRQACLDALHIAGAQCLRLLHESTAIALTWRFDRRDFEDGKAINVAFCSVGHSGLMVAVARFESGAVSILGEAYDLAVSGRHMDREFIKMFAESLRKVGAADPLSSAKARLKLEEAAMKVKKTLSVVDEARATAECVVEDFDLTCDVKRQVFEDICAPLHQNVKDVVARAMTAAKLEVSDLDSVEVVGGVSRVPWIQRALKEAFDGRELRTTLNADEAVARGCAWQAAMLSPHVRLEQIPVQECGNAAVWLEWEESVDIEAEGVQEVGSRRRLLVFEAQSGPNVEAEVAMRCSGLLELSAVSISEDGSQAREEVLGSWTLNFPSEKKEDVEIVCAIDLNGIFKINRAGIYRAKAGVAQPEKEGDEDKAKQAGQSESSTTLPGDATVGLSEATAADADNTGEENGDAPADADTTSPSAAKGAGENEGADAEQTPKASSGAEGGSADGKSAELSPTADEGQEEPSEEDSANAEKGGRSFNWRFWQKWRKGDNTEEGQDAEGEMTAGPRTRRVGGGSQKQKARMKSEPVAVSLVSSKGYGKEALATAVKQELSHRAADEAAVRAENSRNDYETCLFMLRDKLASSDPLMEWASPEEQTSLNEDIEAGETWAYEHVNEDAAVYSERLQALRKRVKELESRKTNLEALEEKIKTFRASIKKYKAAAGANIYSHIAKEKLESITKECDDNAEWITGLETRQASQKKWDPPVFSMAELTIRASSLANNSTKILSEPAPKPQEPSGKKGKDKKNKNKGKDGKGTEAESSKDIGTGNEAAAEDDSSDGVDTAEEKPAQQASRSMRKKLLIGGLALVGIAVAMLFGGLGEPYGLASPWRLLHSEAGEDLLLADGIEETDEDLKFIDGQEEL
mmetsp:Transcript_14695/g.32291  ORF Transcript_14695/g.32291 Transcript_14695/m.32291 type:complete len:1016 (-) Transcript_14695:183-3230(-)|eukprot:CAMPEP_0170587530 /NCGR_PEP_ID=MMETSP0224-20130122/10333_1 /TAXON_ID=285029 /ORGANISM="Togula jolla, Strain CCCM 725" /LENGTH=1015 /DNA_ID=CAMNT_0010911161 /DNA_START=46 /DNA_END=3093 /DNA_ORIENTATION=+